MGKAASVPAKKEEHQQLTEEKSQEEKSQQVKQTSEQNEQKSSERNEEASNLQPPPRAKSKQTTQVVKVVNNDPRLPADKNSAEVAFLLEGIPVYTFKPEYLIRKPVRPRWSSSTDFIFVCLAFTIGFGNLQFPYLVHKNGGVVFLIPYFLALFLVAMPLIILESVIGHLMQKGCITAWGLSPIFRGIGLASAVMLIWKCAYYLMISVWAGYYVTQIFRYNQMPWENCNPIREPWPRLTCNIIEHNCMKQKDVETYYNRTVDCVKVYESPANNATNATQIICECVTFPSEDFFERKVLNLAKGIDEINVKTDFQFYFAIALAVYYVFILICVILGVKLLGKIVYPLLLLPYCIMLSMFLRFVGLPGVIDGLYEFYIKPNNFLGTLMSPQTWIDAFENVLYTFGPGLGVFIALGSYNRKNVHIISQTALVCVITGFTSFIMGLAIFAPIAYAEHKIPPDRMHFKRLIMGNSITNSSDLHLLFSVVPAALLALPNKPWIWTLLFFIMIMFFGFSTQVIAVEALVTAFIDSSICIKIFAVKRFFLSFIVCALVGGLGLFFVFNNGFYLYIIFRNYAATSYPAIIICLFECIAIGWAFGTTEFGNKTKFYLHYVPSVVWRIFWIVITPALLFAALVIKVINQINTWTNPQLEKCNHKWWCKYIFIWLIVLSSIMWIFIFAAVYMCIKRCKLTKEAVRDDRNIRGGITSENMPVIKVTEVLKQPKPKAL